ncbi:carboxymuconolactone decarboxylase family protein [Actinomadura flavalba]|uniref:carboxymuconolactone decarboxylase family protein n=1 Tax=Actinomadura flavalba TaxID=1120938 RepID=UPI000377A4D2|nr:carboxymuconolactone decarboxylase family protein [Actinomadura flavalba]
MTQRIDFAAVAPDGFFAGVLQAAEAVAKSGLDAAVQELVKLRVSQLNGCLYCVDMHHRDARAAGETETRLAHLAAWRESALFTAAEKAALGYAESATHLGPEGVPDDVWAGITGHFTDREIGALVAGVALMNTFNRIAVPSRTPPQS